MPTVNFVITEKTFCHTKLLCDICLNHGVARLNTNEKLGSKQHYEEIQRLHQVSINFIKNDKKIDKYSPYITQYAFFSKNCFINISDLFHND